MTNRTVVLLTLLLSIIFAFLWISVCRTPKQKRLEWGPVCNGLQMAAWRNPGETRVYCVIRNQSEQSIRYNHYGLGHWEFVTVYARPAGTNEWLKLPIRDRDNRPRVGCIPPNVRILLPEKKMYPQYKEGVTPLPPRNYTFSVNLLDFIWPESWKGEIEIRITQRLYRYGSDTWSGDIESPILRISMDEIQDLYQGSGWNVSVEKFSQIKIGMDLSKVKEIMGKPRLTILGKEGTSCQTLHYYEGYPTTDSRPRFVIEIEDDKVISITDMENRK